MSRQTKKSFWLWLFFLSLLALALAIQSSFLPSSKNFSLVPYLAWPPLMFVFLYRDSFSSLSLIFFISLLSHTLFSLPLPAIFILYLFCFFLVFFAKIFFFSKSPLLFFILTFAISFCFPYIVDMAYDFSINDFSLAGGLFYFSKALSTLVWSMALFPLLKKHLRSRADF